MQIYFLYFIAYLLLCSVLFFDIKNKEKIFIVLLFILSFTLMGFRDVSVGTDTLSYSYSYKNTVQKGFKAVIDAPKNSYVFVFLENIFGLFSKGFRGYIVGMSLLISFLSCSFLYIYCRKHLFYSSLLYILLYYFFTSFNISRQFLALLFVSNFIFLLNKRSAKNIVMFLIVVLVGYMIHNTTIFMSLLLPLAMFKNRKNKIVYSFIMSIILVLILNNIGLFNDSFLMGEYEVYLDSNSFYNIEQTGNGRLIILFLSFVPLIIYYIITDQRILYPNIIFDENNITYDEMDANFLSIFIVYTLFGISFYNNLLFSRISFFFAMSSLVIIPKVFDNLKGKKIVLDFIIIIIYIIPFYIQLSNNYAGVLDYEFM